MIVGVGEWNYAQLGFLFENSGQEFWGDDRSDSFDVNSLHTDVWYVEQDEKI